MAKTRSWSVKGIDGETRDLAREAAQASGMTIGAWIDQAILKAKHGELPAIAPADAAPDSRHPEQPIGVLQGQPASTTVPAESSPADRAAAAPITPMVEADSAAPTAVEEKKREIDSPADDVVAERELVAGDSISGEPHVEPRPLSPPPARRSVLSYAVLAIVFAALLGIGGWLLIDLSSPDPTRAPQKIADATPAVEAPPPSPAATSTTAQVAPAPPPAGTTAPGADGLPAGLPDGIRSVVKLAQAGDPKAQYDLGMIYLSGRIGDKNPAEAAKWFERAAEQGIANAQFNLGVLYQRGEGVAQNDKLAFFWYQSAAEQNFAQAQHNLATAYAEGKGIARSYQKAAEWFAKSATAGLSQSQYSLGALHESGFITGKPDTVEARRWYEQALAQGDTRASVRLAILDAPKLPTESAMPARTVTTPVAVPPNASAIGRGEIRQIQTLLNRLNFNPGPADGQMGNRTADAIRLYQKFAGMDEDGAPSRELLEDLRAVAETMAKDG